MYDPQDKYVVLFGGCATGGNPFGCSKVLGDTWTFSAGNWTNISGALSTSPGPRYASAIAYDSTDGYIVMFGGCGTRKASCLLNDTWKFKGGTWYRLAITKSPSPREYSSLANDPPDHAAVLFGGCGRLACPLGDTWTFASGSWVQLSPMTAPLGRFAASTWYDSRDQVVLLQGGVVACGSASCLTNSTWQFVSGAWTHLYPRGFPLVVAFSAHPYDAADQYPVVYGGCTTPSCSRTSGVFLAYTRS